MDLSEVRVRRVAVSEEPKFRQLMQQHHYLGFLPKIGETLWYVAVVGEQWVALLSYSAAALKCGVRDQWIGWDKRHQYAQLKRVVNNSRFLILPPWHLPNLGSRVLALGERRLKQDWPEYFGHSVWLLETFVDPERFRGTVYQAANWLDVGQSRGFRRTRQGYSEQPQSAKKVFLKPLCRNVQQRLSQGILTDSLGKGGSKMTLNAEQMTALPQFFREIPDPRCSQGRRHQLPTVLAIAAGATLCGARGYQAIWGWAQGLGEKARERFRCRVEHGKRVVPSESVIRDVLIRVNPQDLDRALQRWNELYAHQDESLAIDGKTMCNALDEQGQQTHIMSVIGHQTKNCYTQKKSDGCP